MKISASHFPLNGKYEVERKNASEGSSRNFVIGSEVFGIIGNRQGVTRERWALARHKRCKAIVGRNLGTFVWTILMQSNTQYACVPLFVFPHRHPKASTEIGERPFLFSSDCVAVGTKEEKNDNHMSVMPPVV